MRDLTPRQVEILKQTESFAHLRDLYHTIGWTVYRELARARIDNLNYDYLHQNYNPEQAWEARVKLQAIMDFQALMEEIVREAEAQVTQTSLEMMIWENTVQQQEVENG